MSDPFKTLVDFAPDLIVRFDRDLRCVYANRAAERLGLDPAKMESAALAALPLDTEGADRLQDALREAFEQGTSARLDCVFHWPGGGKADQECHVIAEPRPLQADEPVFAIFQDVSARAFREKRDRYQATLLGAVGEALVAVNLEGRVVYWNRQAEGLHGWTREEVWGWHALKLLVPADRLREVALRMRRVARGEAWSGQLELKRADGSAVPVFLTASPVRDASEQIVGIVCTWSDLTQRIQLEEQLRHAQKMEAVGRLAGGVAHDFNNLLTTISGYTELALGSLSSSAPERPFINEVRAAAERASRLTRQLLLFSRKQVLQSRVVEPRWILEGMESFLTRLIGEDVDFVLNVEDEPAAVIGDPTQIEQVILNLVLNARDAMPLGGTVTLSVARQTVDESLDASPNPIPPGEYVVIAVQDTGSGIPPEIQPSIFDPFFTTKPQGKGTGLGLSTVYGIVEQSGGGIVLESQVAVGSTFSVYLPRTHLRADRRLFPPSEETAEKESGASEQTVLLVEDDPSLSQLLTRLLVRLGYHVLRAGNGEEAVDLCRSRSGAVDLVLTDVIMPRMGGIDLALEIRDAFPDIPVLFMSGYVDQIPTDQDIIDVRKNLLQKPFTMEQLGARVRAAIGAATRR